jgi:hypothetical protein
MVCFINVTSTVLGPLMLAPKGIFNSIQENGEIQISQNGIKIVN